MTILDKFLKKQETCVTADSGSAIKSSLEADEHADLIAKSLPWHGNGIYLEDKDNAVKAVCSNADIATAIASCMEYYSSLNAFDGSKAKAYGKFIQDAYYLYVAMSNAKIPVNSIETAFVEKAFHQFCNSLNEIVTRDHLRFETVTGVNSEVKAKAEE